MAHVIELGVDRLPATKVVKRGIKVPAWLSLYLATGNKIDAIKALREQHQYRDAYGVQERLSLRSAKDIVESFGIVSDTTYEDDYRA